MNKQSHRSGSALVIVLGMTAVLMVMAVAFSVIMRTERSGMTNLKHALIARQTTHSAIARVMSAIDESFDARYNWPIPGWNQPYLTTKASTVSAPRNWQSASINTPEERRVNARILSDELSRHLSPAQLALVKNARIDWVPIRAGVGASEVTTQGPKSDAIVARYAFLAFNTTGLLDMNIGPSTNVVDFDAQQAALGATSFVNELSNNNPSTFFSRREDFGGFASFAEMWRALRGDTRYSFVQGEIIVPDLFNTFSLSLDETDPDGKMKLFIPQDTSPGAFGDAQKKRYAKLALDRFERLFQHEQPSVKLATGPLPEVTRAQLATQALIDYIDEDDAPSGGFWEDTPPDPLNYPCTEAVPMVAQAIAELKIADPVVNRDAAEPGNWYREWDVDLIVYVEAQDFSQSPRASAFQFEVNYTLGNFPDVFEALWINGQRENGWEVLIPGDRAAFLEGAITGLPRGTANEVLGAPDTKSFKVRTYAKPGTWDVTDGTPVPGSEEYREFSTYHEDESQGTAPAGGHPTLRLYVDIRATVRKNGTAVQAVPAPALGARPLRVAPGIYHNPEHPDDSRLADKPNEIGWAYCIDPRFAYNTSSMHVYPSGGYAAWISNEMCSKGTVEGSIYGRGGDPYETVWEVADKLREKEQEVSSWDELLLRSGQVRGTQLIERGVFNQFTLGSSGPISDLAKLMNALSGRNEIFPDVYHSESRAGGLFIDGGGPLRPLMDFLVANEPMTSLSEFGNLVIGPWETLSLFATFGPGPANARKIDFHRVSDYFSLAVPRFPKVEDILAASGPGDPLDAINAEYRPGIHVGKLNLNALLKVECDDDVAESGRVINVLNEEPLMVLLASTPIDESGTRLSINQARQLATDFLVGAAVSGELPTTDPFLRMFRNTSDVGNVNVQSNNNPVLSGVMATGSADTDADRERFIGHVLDHLTTRGQSFRVIIRADAYSPKYGTDRAQGGTTLATEYAIVDLWRDPEPNRMPNGAGSTTPVHSWTIRSCRFFSP